MKTQFTAIFSLMGALLTSPCVFGKELGDYNPDELKQAVQDIVKRLHKGYKEPFGTIMYSLGRKSPKGPWDGAWQGEEKPSDGMGSKPKKKSKTCVPYFTLSLNERDYYSKNSDFINVNRGMWRMLGGLPVEDLEAAKHHFSATKSRFIQTDFTNENGSGKKLTYTRGSDGEIEQEVFLYQDGTIKIEFESGGEIKIDSSEERTKDILEIKLPSDDGDSSDDSSSSSNNKW